MIAVSALKGLGVEVARIPSPSMQPTLLGCVEAGVHDRVLVDRICYLLRDPARWDLAAFRFPLQPRDMVVKRIVGLPGERLRIAGGNVYRREPGADGSAWVVLRKPDSLQQAMWREIYPARREVRGEAGALGGSFRAEPVAAVVEVTGGFDVMLREDAPVRIDYVDVDGGLVDRIWDGCPPDLAKRLRGANKNRAWRGEIVPDARLAFRLTGGGPVVGGAIVLAVVRPGLPPRTFGCEFGGGSATLVVTDAAGSRLAASRSCACDLGDGAEIVFAHVDEELQLWRDGVLQMRLDCAAFSCSEGCQLPDPCGLGASLPTPDQHVALHMQFVGRGRAGLRDLHIWRDIHWTRGALEADEVIDVPAGNYFVLGDNPLQSNDSRSWRAMTVGVAADGSLQPPDGPGVHTLRGNLEPEAGDEGLTRTTNPIAVPSRGVLLFVDDRGEPHALDCDRELVFEQQQLQLRARGGVAAPWTLPTAAAPFVPREAIAGRVVLRLWPVPPFGPWRPGWIR